MSTSGKKYQLDLEGNFIGIRSEVNDWDEALRDISYLLTKHPDGKVKVKGLVYKMGKYVLIYTYWLERNKETGKFELYVLEEGRNKITISSFTFNRRALNNMNMEQLKQYCVDNWIKGYSKKNKRELIDYIVNQKGFSHVVVKTVKKKKSKSKQKIPKYVKWLDKNGKIFEFDAKYQAELKLVDLMEKRYKGRLYFNPHTKKYELLIENKSIIYKSHIK